MDRNIKHTSINTRTASTRRKPLQCLNNTRRTILISCSKPKIIIGPQVKTPSYLGSPSAQHTIITINSDKCPKSITLSNNEQRKYFFKVLTSTSCYCHWCAARQHRTTHPGNSKSDVQNNPNNNNNNNKR